MEATAEVVARLKTAAAAHGEDYLAVTAEDLAALVVAAAPNLKKPDRLAYGRLAQAAAKSQDGTADLHRQKHLAVLLKAAEGAAPAPEPEPAE